jgi:hypothetical protein
MMPQHIFCFAEIQLGGAFDRAKAPSADEYDSNWVRAVLKDYLNDLLKFDVDYQKHHRETDG